MVWTTDEAYLRQFPEKLQGAPLRLVEKQITAAQVLTLNATPVVLIPAPGAGRFVLPDITIFFKSAGTAYAGIAVGEDLALRYTNGSGTILQASETTGFLDQATAQTRVVTGLQSAAATGLFEVAPTANAAIVVHMLAGEITTGNSPIRIRTYYRVLPSTLTV
jgi:hypothetical protein